MGCRRRRTCHGVCHVRIPGEDIGSEWASVQRKRTGAAHSEVRSANGTPSKKTWKGGEGRRTVPRAEVARICSSTGPGSDLSSWPAYNRTHASSTGSASAPDQLRGSSTRSHLKRFVEAIRRAGEAQPTPLPLTGLRSCPHAVAHPCLVPHAILAKKRLWGNSELLPFCRFRAHPTARQRTGGVVKSQLFTHSSSFQK